DPRRLLRLMYRFAPDADMPRADTGQLSQLRCLQHKKLPLTYTGTKQDQGDLPHIFTEIKIALQKVLSYGLFPITNEKGFGGSSTWQSSFVC
ncbi:hypothetical protein PoB_002243300, partial [Plakobranchus ocellatus]